VDWRFVGGGKGIKSPAGLGRGGILKNPGTHGQKERE